MLHRRIAALGLCATLVTGAEAHAQEKAGMIPINVTVGEATLAATLDDTIVGRDFAAMLPLDLTLSDFHGIEKVSDLPRAVDTSEAPATYEPAAGDITFYAPWGNLAIFYKPFQPSGGLVRLGTFDGAVDALLQDSSFEIRIERADQPD